MFRPYLAIFRSICYLQLTVEKRKHITYNPLSKHILYVFSSPLLIVDSILTWRWPSTVETFRHRRTNKLRYLDSCVLTDLPTLIRTSGSSSLLCFYANEVWWVRPEDGQARPKHVVFVKPINHDHTTVVFWRTHQNSFETECTVYSH